jgi:hypothetical protein
VLSYMLKTLVPAECLAQYPERDRNGYKEQAETNWAAPAEPRTPRAPMFQAVLVAPAILFFDVLETFAFVLHIVPY